MNSVGSNMTDERTLKLKDKSMQTMHVWPAKDARDIQAIGTTRLGKLVQTLKIQWPR